LVRALVDAWYRKHEDIPADVVRRLLEKLSEPPVLLDPIAVEAARQLFGSLNYLGGSEGAVSPERQCATESDVSRAAAASSAPSPRPEAPSVQ